MDIEKLNQANKLVENITEFENAKLILKQSLKDVKRNSWYFQSGYICVRNSLKLLEIPEHLTIEAIEKSITYYENEIAESQKQLNEL